jgi:hypothetical protein
MLILWTLTPGLTECILSGYENSRRPVSCSSTNLEHFTACSASRVRRYCTLTGTTTTAGELAAFALPAL